MSEASQTSPEPKSSVLGCLLQALGAAALVAAIVGCALYLYFGIDSNYTDRADVRPERGRALIPPAATDITLDRHPPVDREAWVAVHEMGLNAFFDEHHGRDQELDSYAEWRLVARDALGERDAALGWA